MATFFYPQGGRCREVQLYTLPRNNYSFAFSLSLPVICFDLPFFDVDNPRGLKENTAMDNIEKANKGKALEISEKWLFFDVDLSECCALDSLFQASR